MATTSYGVNDSLSNKLWAKKLSAEALKETYFGKFMGDSSDNMIHMKSEASINHEHRILKLSSENHRSCGWLNERQNR